MKYILCAALLWSATSFSQKPIEVSSKINEVIVYPQGAQIDRSATKQLAAGRQFILFQGLESELQPSSISVSASGGVNVLSVSTQVNYLNESLKPKSVKLLEDSLRTAEFDFKFNQNMLGVYTEEKNMILANKSVGWGGEGGDFVIEDLEDLSDFYRDRLTDIMLKVMELDDKQTKLSKGINRMRQQLAEYNTKLNRSTGEILVEVYTAASATANFKFSYMVSNAGWVPSYDVKVAEVNQPIQLFYNAKVFQNTGSDWNEVLLTLTNANPNLSGNKPEIHPWTLYFIDHISMNVRGARADAMSNTLYEMAPAAAMDKKSSMDDEIEFGTTVSYPMNEAATQFRIKTRHNIPSNGKPQGISIDEFTVAAEYQYYCAPKLDPTAFLIARVSGFEQYDLLPGQANLFFGNTFVGETYIDPSIIDDTLDLSLGRDQSIVVKREKIKDYNVSKKVGNSTKQSLGIEISAKNTKATSIELVIEDQIPISSDKEIEVVLDEAKTAVLKPETGTLRWTKNIGAGSSEIFQFRYSVKYPSDRKINL